MEHSFEITIGIFYIAVYVFEILQFSSESITY